jgi:hypothetical protein
VRGRGGRIGRIGRIGRGGRIGRIGRIGRTGRKTGRAEGEDFLGPVRIFVCEAYHDDEQESVCQASASSPSGRSLSLS